MSDLISSAPTKGEQLIESHATILRLANIIRKVREENRRRLSEAWWWEAGDEKASTKREEYDAETEAIINGEVEL